MAYKLHTHHYLADGQASMSSDSSRYQANISWKLNTVLVAHTLIISHLGGIYM